METEIKTTHPLYPNTVRFSMGFLEITDSDELTIAFNISEIKELRNFLNQLNLGEEK